MEPVVSDDYVDLGWRPHTTRPTKEDLLEISEVELELMSDVDLRQWCFKKGIRTMPGWDRARILDAIDGERYQL